MSFPIAFIKNNEKYHLITVNTEDPYQLSTRIRIFFNGSGPDPHFQYNESLAPMVWVGNQQKGRRHTVVSPRLKN